MPNIKSAKKALKKSERKKIINARSKVKMKKIIKNLNELARTLEKKTEKITDDKLKEIEEILKNAYKQIDKTSKRGIIKKNTASRKKSKLAKKVNSLQQKKSNK
ncbi:MAG: 30S ribosomal protein S20 [Candidatus Pacebacteria bacterium]|nr:30S ribosomal protein S20 [Candidatus Paceibacterota bacterium]